MDVKAEVLISLPLSGKRRVNFA